MTARYGTWCSISLSVIVALTARPLAQTLPVGSNVPIPAELWLEGSIGDDASVRLYISTPTWPKANGPKPDGLEGMYYYTKHWEPIPLDGACLTSGDCLSEGRLRLDEGEPYEDVPKPNLELEIHRSEQVLGTWTSSDGARKLPVRLRKVPQPEEFHVALRRLSRFADSRWPITLEYPQGWLLRVTDTTLLLRSTDPMFLMFDKQLQCSRGSGLPSAPHSSDLVEWFQGDFGLTMNGWRIKPFHGTRDAKDCENEACEVPDIRRVGTAVFMTGAGGYRGYGPWGYSGMVDTNEYLVIDGAEWVHCRDRLFIADRIGVRSARR